jgi:mono/diheme cytochrome c family protein
MKSNWVAGPLGSWVASWLGSGVVGWCVPAGRSLVRTLGRNTTLLVLVALGIALDAPSAAQEAATERGRQVYEKWCTPCHGAGEGKPGTIAASALYKGSKPAVLLERTDLTPASIKAAVRTGVFVMPRFRKTEITDTDLESIVGYLTRKTAPSR